MNNQPSSYFSSDINQSDSATSSTLLVNNETYSPTDKLFKSILLDALHVQASDIHFEPYENFTRVRFRCDGTLTEYQKPSFSTYKKLIAHIKVLAELDISEQRKPQDGRMQFQDQSDNLQQADLRVSTLPTQWGEKLVLRILKSNKECLRIDQLGMSQIQEALFTNALDKTQGLILITGPTGSGKTVSLYAALQYLNKPEVNIACAEDPVEITIPGINQVQVKHQIGFNFSEALRAFLRQDPDIIMLGEIRDSETAKMTVKAAQTGHLVLSTLHTNSASESLQRLINMGVEPYNLTSCVSLVVAQRLIKKLCPKCKKPQIDTTLLDPVISLSDAELYQANPSGCQQCNQGYAGRLAIFEAIEMNEELAGMLLSHSPSENIEKYFKAHNIFSLHESAIEALHKGFSSYQEIKRVLSL